jgi:hypothetical protein
MNKVKAAQAFFAGVHTITTVENTYRPVLNGTRRRITHLGKTFFDAELLDDTSDGRNTAGQDCRGVIPARAGDVLSISETEVTFRLGQPGTRLAEHHVTYRKDSQPAGRP